MSSPVSLRDVARAAEVSVAAVSYTLNGKGEHYRIGADTQARIRATALRLGYRPDSLTQAIRAGNWSREAATPNSPTGRREIGLVVGENSPSSSLALIPGQELLLAAEGFTTVLITLPSATDGLRHRLAELATAGFSGILCCPSVFTAVAGAMANSPPMIALSPWAAATLLGRPTTETTHPTAPPIIPTPPPVAPPTPPPVVDRPSPVPTPEESPVIAEPTPEPLPTPAEVVPVPVPTPEPAVDQPDPASVVTPEPAPVIDPTPTPEPVPVVVPEPTPMPTPEEPPVIPEQTPEPLPSPAEVMPVPVPTPEPVPVEPIVPPVETPASTIEVPRPPEEATDAAPSEKPEITPPEGSQPM